MTPIAPGLEQLLEQQPAVPSVNETRNRLRAILADPKYSADQGQTTQSTLLERFLDWLGKILRGTGLPLASGWAMLAAGLVIVGVLYLIVRLLWELSQRRRRMVTVPATTAEHELEPDALLRAAAQAAQRQDFRSAVRLHFQALIKQLGIASAPWQTNSQLAQRVLKLTPAAAGPFRAAAHNFEDSWYGALPCGPAEYEQLAADARTALAAVRAAGGGEL